MLLVRFSQPCLDECGGWAVAAACWNEREGDSCPGDERDGAGRAPMGSWHC